MGITQDEVEIQHELYLYTMSGGPMALLSAAFTSHHLSNECITVSKMPIGVMDTVIYTLSRKNAVVNPMVGN